LQTAKIAANCIRTLVLLSTQPKATIPDQTIARGLLPKLIVFVTNTEPEDPENARALIAQTLCHYAAGVSKDHTAIAMALVVPALLSRASSEGDGESSDAVYRETSARLLELASADQVAFRGVVGAMNEAQKAFMEEVIRSGRQAGATRKSDEGEGRPTIALKMNFGG
jgi:HEAT repeat-containing protein 5